MEKKTIGGFIATLRKANGMTQKELAEHLNVSDKTVSRWERDDGTPDLSLIPVIAELFGITCDELLQGKRKSPTERTETEVPLKGEKQRQRLLKSTFAHYQNLTYISIGVSTAGLIAALICNLAFLRAMLGFLIGTIFFMASIICQIIFLNQTFLSVEDAELEETSLWDFKRQVILLTEKALGLTVGYIGFTFPLIMIDTYWGLAPDNLLLFGSIGIVLFLIIYGVILYFVNNSLIKRGIYQLSDKELEIYYHNRILKKKCAIAYSITLACTLLFHSIGSEIIWSTHNLASIHCIEFEDYESFIQFMEQDIPCEDGMSYEVMEWYDEYGNIITEEEALTRTLEDINGIVVCTYLERNQSVSYIQYDPQDGTVLPIQVVTNTAVQTAANISILINDIYCLLYAVELLAVLGIYFKKRAK